MGKSLLIMGASARAAAQSAIRAGYEPWCIDLFADRDLAEVATVRRCRASFYPEGMIEKMRWAPPSQVLITGAVEHHPEVLTALAMKRQLFRWTLKQIFGLRDPQVWQQAPTLDGVRYPRIITGGRLPEPGDHERYLMKPLDTASPRPSATPLNNGQKPGPDRYLQQWIDGTPVGAVYHCTAGRCTLLGVTRQLVGEAKLHARPMAYCGSVGPIPLDAKTRQAFEAMGAWLAEEHQLTGVFNIDAMVDASGDVWPVEINPRYSASVEVLERALDFAALGDEPPHVAGQGGQGATAAGRLHGKVYLFNGRDRALLGDEVLPHLPTERGSAADIPQPWRRIMPGGPICTLFAEADDVDGCLAELYRRAGNLYTALPR